MCSAQVLGFALTENDELMVKQLDSLKEYRELATIRLAKYQQKLARRYNRDMKRRDFSAGDLVLRKADGKAREINTRKIAPNWEGPYRVTAIARTGMYYLEDMDERPPPRPWSIQNLRRFYH